MISRQLLIEYFSRRINVLAAEKGLRPAEERRILDTFQKALKDPYMDEHRVHALLTDKAGR